MGQSQEQLLHELVEALVELTTDSPEAEELRQRVGLSRAASERLLGAVRAELQGKPTS